VGEQTKLNEDHDTWVPDTVVNEEFGISRMGLRRWTKDPRLGFPPPIKIRTKNYRSRRALEQWKERMVQDAIRKRAK
jgi:hypothetical protein